MSNSQPVASATSQAVSDRDGVVKWFDPRKGFGFVIGPDGQDVFIHFSVIEQDEGFRTLRDGERVVYSAQPGPKGWAATRVRANGRESKNESSA
jgi:CspA family cold shock protein